MTPRKATTTRESILNAASLVLLASGANQLTLEAVAQEAGVSKGGLLYHFPTKEALIEGMVGYYIQQFEKRLESLRQADDDPAAWLRVYTQATFDADSSQIQGAAALLAAVAVNPALLEPLRLKYDEWQERFRASTRDPVLATIVRLALDGLWAAELLGFAPPDPELRTQISARLLSLLEEAQQ